MLNCNCGIQLVKRGSGEFVVLLVEVFLSLILLLRSVTRSYYRGASACLLVYDITKRATFDTLERWLVDARALASPDLVVVVVGNKLDREEEREVGYVEASRWAGEHGE